MRGRTTCEAGWRRLRPGSAPINFFDAEFHDHGRGAMADVIGTNVFSFDVTELLRRYLRSGTDAAHDSLLVTIVPAGRPTGGQPMVGVVELMRQ